MDTVKGADFCFQENQDWIWLYSQDTDTVE